MSDRSQTEQRYTFHPVALDLWDPKAFHPAVGTEVVKCQPPGTPRNGTMGHCFIEEAATGRFCGLVLENSLQPVDGA